MHDPKVVAFEIYLGAQKKKNGQYRSSFITIWHNDPETDGSDDSCGWSFPKISDAEREWLKKVAKDQYHQMLAKTVAERENKSYAYICYDQDVYGIIYWMWRHFNRELKKETWQYGSHLSNKELQYIYQMATNPVDNFQGHDPKTFDNFEQMLFLIYRCWKKYHRKWWQHPRWHFHHWSIQFRPYQRLKRRFWDKCCMCGKRGFKGSAIGDWNGTKIWHPECDNSYDVKSPSPDVN